MTDNNAALPSSDIQTITIEDEMRSSYLAYAMSVIVSRALPDVRDGLKPVHRRILFAMKEGGFDSSKPYKKSARIVGDVMGKYHPHGDSAIYDAMVRMAQSFSMRLPLIDGQGNFGSMDGDNPAAMRYTEARLDKAAETMLEDIDKDTVDFHPNYDESLQEPDVLPSRYPNLLVNGGGGIAVGMATNIAPHNLGEVIDATLALIKNPDISIDELLDIIPGPDFPTGAIILGTTGCRSAMHTGRGSITMRARHIIEEIRKDRQAIVFTEIPFQLNKENLVKRIAECVHEKIIEGISELRDESDRDGVRVVVELKRDAMAEVVLNQLFAHTPLQSNFSVNMLALNNGRPELLNLRGVLTAFVDFREKTINRRTEYELKQARDRAHVLLGLAVAVANIDEIIALIRRANDPAVARAELIAKAWPVGDVGPLITLVDDAFDATAANATYKLSELQAKAILDLRLHRLTGLERDKIGNDLKEIVAQIADYLDILSKRERVFQIMSDEMAAIRLKFATPRRTIIEPIEFEQDIEDLIQREDMVVTVSHAGYVKRVPLSTYRAQKRGGKGRTGMATKDEDFVSDIFVASTHTPMLFFSSLGRVYKLKVYKLPLGNPQSRGKALVNMLPLEQGETITTVLHLPEDETTWANLNVMFATGGGTVRRNQLSDFSNVRPSGIIAMKLEEGERLISVNTCAEHDDVLLATKQGKAIRFAVDDVRVFAGRNSVGVRGVRLPEGDAVISMSILRHVEATADERAAYLRQANAARRAAGEEELASAGGDEEETTTNLTLSPERFAELASFEDFLITVSERGFGKRTSAYEYRLSGRGGQGIWNMDMSERNGLIVATFPVKDGQEIMLVSDGGQIIRAPVKDIRIAGRRTQGVTVFRVDTSEKVVSVAAVDDQSGEATDNGDVETVEGDSEI